MAKYTITIDLGNAAFEAQEGLEVSRILRSLANACEVNGVATATSLRDVNGNTVGQAKRTGR
jgi:hypothetical protein